ncbi:MAG: hypothetical protein ABSH08_02000 [Tepidisphaeraceae bacterium]
MPQLNHGFEAINGGDGLLDVFAAEVDEAIRAGQVAELNPDEL